MIDKTVLDKAMYRFFTSITGSKEYYSGYAGKVLAVEEFANHYKVTAGIIERSKRYHAPNRIWVIKVEEDGESVFADTSYDPS